jgi:signal transduction histidine kinase
MVSTHPRPGLHGTGLVISVLMTVAIVGWLVALFLDDDDRFALVGTVVCIGAGLALFGIGPNGVALVFVASGCVQAGLKLPNRLSLPIAAAAAAGLTIVELLGRAEPLWIGGGVGGIALCLLGGVVRRQAEQQHEQTQLLLAETQLARQEQARSAALAERARIAREIHDVLAHTLTALSVQLETIDALLDRKRPEQAQETVHRAQTLMREGLAETRRAISALRDDAPPLPELLRLLCDAYVKDTGASATVEVRGPERKLTAEAGLTLFRTAQEAVTNVRKHAPNAAVVMCLGYRPAEVSLTVTSTGGGEPDDAAFPRVGGYGLTGLRERVELAGGSFDAAPVESGWRVAVMIPA